MFKQYNANPADKLVGDCTVRAISLALDQDWEKTYIGIALTGFCMRDMPSSDDVWGEYLLSQGFVRKALPEAMTVSDFCRDNPNGVFILTPKEHVIAAINGDYYDTWDSGDKIINYFWQRKEQ